jgi:exopolysaccharide biosynthesis polyprenyl glycosylphosphotransferase
VFQVVTTGVWFFQVCAFVARDSTHGFARLLTFWASAFVLTIAGRGVALFLARRSPEYVENTLVIGADDAARLLARKILAHPEYGLRLVGFIVDGETDPPGSLNGVAVLGSLAALQEHVVQGKVDRVILASPTVDNQELIHELKRAEVRVDVVPSMFDVLGPGTRTKAIEGITLLTLPVTGFAGLPRYTKRAVDLTVASIALILTAPLFAWIAWRVRRDSPGPVFFRQPRLGLHMRELTMIKFRTMRMDADQDLHRAYKKTIMDRNAEPGTNGLFKLDRKGEITPFGGWLRRTSLDELPQLINVLRGEMSLVGPRPCLRYEIESYAPHHFERFAVPPGMTGLWQVAARSRSTFVEALDMDVAYVRNWSLGLDLQLLARTPMLLIRPNGAA